VKHSLLGERFIITKRFLGFDFVTGSNKLHPSEARKPYGRTHAARKSLSRRNKDLTQRSRRIAGSRRLL
jgi:hypothetical protein